MKLELVRHPMDASEAIVEEYLRAQGFTDVVHEPDGNVPPDFLLNGHIAVEVRRLNQHERAEDGHCGLEHVQVRVAGVLKKVCDSLGPAKSGPSWFVMCEYRRPLPPRKQLETLLAAALVGFVDPPGATSPSIQVAPHFQVQLVRASTPHCTRFILGAFSDHDSGGLVLSEMRRNLKICMEQKRRKVARVQTKYPVWWLALTDHIGHGLSAQERDQLRTLITVGEPWDKVILVDPAHPDLGFEL